jgi:hypothetical protein
MGPTSPGLPDGHLPTIESGEDSRTAARDARRLTLLLWITTLEGIAASVAIVLSQLSPGGESSPDLPASRLVIIATAVALTAACIWLAVKAVSNRVWLEGAVDTLRNLAARRHALALSVAAFYVGVGAVVIGLLGVSLRQNPELGDLLQGFVDRGFLLLIWLTLMALQGFIILAALSGASLARSAMTFAIGGLAIALTSLYWYGAEGQLLHYNVNFHLIDQSAYMEYARLLRQTGYSYPGDFNRMPAYPFLLSLVWREGMTDAKFFLAGKYFNLALSLPLLAGLALLFFQRLPRILALNLVLIIGFTVFIYKAGWVQAELLFYFLNTCLFLLIWRLLKSPTVPLAVLAGIVAGLAHLTKAAILPSLALFAAFGLWRGVWLWRPSVRLGGRAIPRGAVKALLILPLSAAAFLAVLFPYLRVTQRITGHAFYNVNSTFYVWYDSWEQAEAGTKAHGDRVGWPDLPPEEIPSMGKFLREHTAEQIVTRLVDGGRKVMDRVLRSSGYIDYVGVYGAVLVLAAAVNIRRAWEEIRKNAFPFMFFACYFPAYFLLYFWYAPIAAGDRLILAQFIPLLLVLSAGWQNLLQHDRLRIGSRSMTWRTVLGMAVLVMAGERALWALTQGVYVIRGGG